MLVSFRKPCKLVGNVSKYEQSFASVAGYPLFRFMDNTQESVKQMNNTSLLGASAYLSNGNLSLLQFTLSK